MKSELSLFGFLRRGTERKNALLHAASQFCGLCRGSVDILGAPLRFWSNREDLPLALRVFWGLAGLQSSEKGANSREDPGMDDPTVSPVWLIYRCFSYCTSKLIVAIDFHASLP